jgi:hypothetical protein
VLQVFNSEKEEKKMKTKKNVIAVLTAALVTAFIIGCVAPMDSPNFGTGVTPSGRTTPDGKVLVSLNLVNSDSGARTVLPTLGGYATIDGFDYFTLTVTKGGVSQGLPLALQGDIAAVATITSTAIPLDSGGNYVFTVIAYDSGDDRRALGTYTITNLGSTNNTINIVLKEIVDGLGSGFFTVTSNASGYDSADLTMTPLSVTGTADQIDIDITGNDYEDIPLKSGYYRMTIALTKANCEPVTVVEIVHIYENFTTTYIDTLPTLRSNLHAITYSYTLDGGAVGTGMPSENVAHGASITNLTATNSIPPVGYVFGAWYDGVNGTSTAVAGNVVGATTKIIRPLTLYAKWEPAQTNVSISSVTLKWGGDNPPVISGTATYSQALGTITILISVASPELYGNMLWFNDQNTQIGTGDTLNIGQTFASATGGALNWWQAGTHTITFTATEGGIPYSTQQTIVCTPIP